MSCCLATFHCWFCGCQNPKCPSIKTTSFILLLKITLSSPAQRDFILKDRFSHFNTGIWCSYTATYQVVCIEGTILVLGFNLQSCLVSIKYFQMPEQTQPQRVPMQLMNAMHSLQCTWKWVSNILKCAHDPALGKRSMMSQDAFQLSSKPATSR